MKRLLFKPFFEKRFRITAQNPRPAVTKVAYVLFKHGANARVGFDPADKGGSAAPCLNANRP
jgi:hypothetical protein